MKVLFLDFDGVLNSERYVRDCGHYGVVIDPSRMLLLKSIIDATDAKIVLSTSWREHWDRDAKLCDNAGNDINGIFGEYRMQIFDKTPKLYTNRETEIAAWLSENPQVETFAVLDDAFLSAEYLIGHFVKTSNYRNGLEKEDAEKVTEILNGGTL